MFDAVNKVRHAQRQLRQELGREPEAEDLAGCDFEMPVEKVNKILRAAEEPIPLETPADGGDDDLFPGNDIPVGEDVASPLDNLFTREIREQTEKVLKTLTSREESIHQDALWFCGRRRTDA